MVAFRVCAVGRGEDTDEVARVLGVPGVHQPQRAFPEFHPELVHLHVVGPGRRGGAEPGVGVVGEDGGGVLATGEAPLQVGVVEVFRGSAGERQVSALASPNFYRKRNFICGGKEP